MPPSSDALIHAVLDGEASAAQRAELDRRMETDLALRARFEAMHRVFTMLEAVPAIDPPAGLVESILARATLSGRRREVSHQPFARPNVIAAYPVDNRAGRPRGNWVSALVHFVKEIGMNDQKPGFLGTNRGKLLVTAGVAAVALVGISTVIDFPIGGTSTTGTIVPAERHRAPQNSAADINVGLPGGAAGTSSVATEAAASDASGQAGRSALGAAANKAEVKADILMRNATDVKADALTRSAADVKADALTRSAAEVKADALTRSAAEVKADAVMRKAADVKADAVMRSAAEVKADAVMRNAAEVKAEAVMRSAADAKVNARQ